MPFTKLGADLQLYQANVPLDIVVVTLPTPGWYKIDGTIIAQNQSIFEAYILDGQDTCIASGVGTITQTGCFTTMSIGCLHQSTVPNEQIKLSCRGNDGATVLKAGSLLYPNQSGTMLMAHAISNG